MSSFATMPGPGEPDSAVVHGQYFWDLLTFKVENTLLRLPSYRFLTESECFASMHGIPTQAQGGSTPSRDPFQEVYTLDTTLREFEHLLKIMYPKTPSHSPSITGAITQEEWTSVLKLSTLWFFEDLRNMAISRLGSFKMDPIRRVCLAKQFNIESWLLSGYRELVVFQPRPRLITQEDAQKIGYQTALSLSNIVVRRQHNNACTTQDGMTIDEVIRTVFAQEFDHISEVLAERRAFISLHDQKRSDGSAASQDGYALKGKGTILVESTGDTPIPLPSKPEDGSDSGSASLQVAQVSNTLGIPAVHDQMGDNGHNVGVPPRVRQAPPTNARVEANIQAPNPASNTPQRQALIQRPQPMARLSMAGRLALGVATAVSNARQQPNVPRAMIQTIFSDVAKALGT